MKLTHHILKSLIKEELLGLQEQTSCPQGYTPVQLPDGNSKCVPTEEESDIETYPQTRAPGQTFPTTGTSTEDKPADPAPPTTRARVDVKETDACKKRYTGKWAKYLQGCLQHVASGGDLQGYRQKMGWAKPQDRAEAAAVDPGAPQPQRREKTRLGRKGDKILRKNGFKGFDDFYEQLRKHDLTKLLGPSKEDRKWGGAHQIAMQELKKAEDEAGRAEMKQAEVSTEEHTAMMKNTAVELYGELKGAGSGRAAAVLAELVGDACPDGGCLADLYDAFTRALEFRNDTEDGDLIKWLRNEASPAVKGWAPRVAKAVKKRNAKKAQEEAEAEAMEQEEVEQEAGLEENTTHSSFSKHQKLFENWNRYVKSIEED